MTSHRNPSERVAIFIDVQNMYYGARSQYNGKLNYNDFMKFVLRGRSLIRGIAYIVEKNGYDQSGFKNALEISGLEVRSKPLIERADGSMKGNWDIAIAVDAMAIGPRVDTVILASGDGDFMHLAEALRNIGCRVEAYGFNDSTSSNLVRSVNEFTSIPEELCFYESNSRRRQPARY